MRPAPPRENLRAYNRGMRSIAVDATVMGNRLPCRRPHRREISAAHLAAQREQQFREMGRVEGMPDWALPSGFASSVRQTRPTAKKVKDDKGGYTDNDHDNTKAD